MYCVNCGKEIEAGALYCGNCGTRINQDLSQRVVTNNNYVNNVQEEDSGGLNVLSFLFPLIGFILWIVYMDSRPKRSSGCGKWALISTVLYILLYACAASV